MRHRVATPEAPWTRAGRVDRIKAEGMLNVSNTAAEIYGLGHPADFLRCFAAADLYSSIVKP